MTKFKVIKHQIYEDTGDRTKDRLVMIAMHSGVLAVGPGLGDDSERLYESVPEALSDLALDYWRTNKDRVELTIRGTNLPICPKCGNGNAMLDYYHYMDDVGGVTTYKCRDCHLEVYDHEAVLVYTELDAPGMGRLSTYTEVKRVPADHRRTL